ncbi:MAG: inorganic phosphate transporter [Lentisphaerae bacterium RIFOXYB12_FULL_65_16]|nr:MAG: inorganic phosphate transporter [Lentisphaerae bacterium RIFOXYA12_64_32]OGV85243.1 MAG: inorganic phosphate transporter [Lentisphaerae bacterium RIFOXYB12_FULL_65_16]
MPDIPLLLIVIVLVALVFDYTNGAHDAANAIAPVISTRVMSPKAAVIMAVLLNFLGAFLGTSVAETMGKGIINLEMILGCRTLLLAALIGAILWNVLTWWLGMPSSSSHALVGGLMGAAIVTSGWDCLQIGPILKKVILPLFLSPLGGFLAGYVLMVGIAHATRSFRYRPTNTAFKRLQILTSGFMALSHGLNDAQKTMGIITLALVIFHQIPELVVPFWVKVACAGAMGAGTMSGGWKIIKTMGQKIFKMEPVHGFAAQTATTAVIMIASWAGAPISTTQVISSSVLGVGASKRFSAVHWEVGGRMVVAWFVTIPASALVGGGVMVLIRLLG